MNVSWVNNVNVFSNLNIFLYYSTLFKSYLALSLTSINQKEENNRFLKNTLGICKREYILFKF